MDEIMVTVSVISAKDGSIIEKTFPLDEGLYKAIKTLSEEEQLSYFTSYYREWKHEDNMRHKHYGGSIDFQDDVFDLVHDIPDTSLTPDQYCMEEEKKERLERGLKKLTDLQSTVIYLIYVENKTQQEVADQMGSSQPNVAKVLGKALAKLRREFPDEN